MIALYVFYVMNINFRLFNPFIGYLINYSSKISCREQPQI